MATNEAFIMVDPDKFGIQMATIMSSDSFSTHLASVTIVSDFIRYIHIYIDKQMCMPRFRIGDVA
jgi:hypothetical protein